MTGRTVDDPHRLALDLDAIAEAGIAIEDQEAIVGEAELAAPVIDHRGHPIGAIGVVGASERLAPGAPSEMLVTAIRDAARGLSGAMGGRAGARR